jgi:hypothetical protein
MTNRYSETPILNARGVINRRERRERGEANQLNFLSVLRVLPRSGRWSALSMIMLCGCNNIQPATVRPAVSGDELGTLCRDESHAIKGMVVKVKSKWDFSFWQQLTQIAFAINPANGVTADLDIDVKAVINGSLKQPKLRLRRVQDLREENLSTESIQGLSNDVPVYIFWKEHDYRGYSGLIIAFPERQDIADKWSRMSRDH